jgi:antitoxin component YwqK of YwqJK toxin-antitoxin module
MTLIRITILLIGLSFWNCERVGDSEMKVAEKTVLSNTPKEVDFKVLQLLPNEGIFVYQNIPYSGLAIANYPNSSQTEKRIEFKNGKKDGLFELFYIDGQLSQQTSYANGKRNGISKTWWKDGQIRSESNFKNDKGHGIQKQWYRAGMIFKIMNLENGKEIGLQQAWRKTGELYANYEAKNGRIYGLKKANLCFSLEAERLK